MNIRLACALAAVALVTVLSTQTYAKDTFKTPKTPVSLIGCIQREADYRRQHGSGKGGFLGFGGGLGNEYVLINTSRRGSGDCATASGGEAYELTGSEEGDLKPFVGQRVAITGVRKSAEVDALTGRPTGGRQAGYDLRLFEVDVDSFRALPPVRTRTVARVKAPPRQFARQADANRGAQAPIERRQDVDAHVDELPGTASSLPLIGLAGLLALATGLTLRVAARRG